MNTDPVDVAFVRMPYSEVGQPSLALGLLKAVCDRHGIKSRALPANIWFSEEFGPAIHDMIFEAYSTSLIGEWTFSGALFPDFHPDDDAYLRKVTAQFKLDSQDHWRHIRKRYPLLDEIALLREIRDRAPEFIELVADRVLELEPRIVGCTSTFQQHCASVALLRRIKERRPDVITMIGGANCEADMGRVTFQQFPWLDFVVSGEAEGFFGGMCTRLLKSGLEGIAPGELPPGVWGPHHRKDPEGVASECAGQIDGAPIARLGDMNESPVPNYDDYFAYLAETKVLHNWVQSALPFQTARGCWWGEKTHCSFCGISRTAMKFRPKSGDNVIGQMLALRDKYAINLFQGTEYIFDYRYFDTLLPRLKEVGGYFRFEVKANLKPEQLQGFIDSGTLEVQPGVESLNDELLALLKKGTTAYQNILLLKRARKVGLLIYWNMLHTIPGDRDELYAEMADTLPLVHHLQPPHGIAQIHYDRFSPYWRNPESHGLELRPAYGYEYTYPFPPETLKDIAYFFETARQRAGHQIFDPVKNAGLLRFVQAVFDWRNEWRNKRNAPVLQATDLGDRILFEDTRASALSRSFEIHGLEARIYRAAENGITPAHLTQALHKDEACAAGDEDVQAAVARLTARRVLAVLSNRLLSLAVPTPVPAFAAHTVSIDNKAMNPGKARLEADALLDEVRPNIALSCLRVPYDQPLTSWLAPAPPLEPVSAE